MWCYTLFIFDQQCPRSLATLAIPPDSVGHLQIFFLTVNHTSMKMTLRASMCAFPRVSLGYVPKNGIAGPLRMHALNFN